MIKKNLLKNICVSFLCVCMICTMVGMPQGKYSSKAAKRHEVTWNDGTYDGEGSGYNPSKKIKLSVTISKGKIAKIDVISHGETPSYWNMAKVLLEKIINQQSCEVDSVSGATMSSNGIKEAVQKALEQASSDPNSPFSQGDGTQQKPYVIKDAQKLALFAKSVDEGTEYEGKFIVLKNDIDLSEIDNWNPIGEEKTSEGKIFKGSFDGQGFTIKGMHIRGKYKDSANIGLFSGLAPTAKVRNLKLRGVKIKVKGNSGINAGAIAGEMSSSLNKDVAIIDTSSAKGSISVNSSGNKEVTAGGLVGKLGRNNVMANAWTDMDVTAISQGGNASAISGGIAAVSGVQSVLTNVSSFGDIYASAPLSNHQGGEAGGVVGELSGKLWNSYATGAITVVSGNIPHRWIGALAGKTTVEGMVQDGHDDYSYPPQGEFRKGNYFMKEADLSFESQGTQTVINPPEASGKTTASSPAFDPKFKGEKISKKDLGTPEFIDMLDDNLSDVNKLKKAYGVKGITLKQWSLEEGRAIPAGDEWSPSNEPEEEIFDSGKGTKKNPYVIKTKEQLKAFAASVTKGISYFKRHIVLGRDIDISGSNWEPIGVDKNMFNGHFDGKNHSIQGMTMGTKEEPIKVSAKDKNNVKGLFCILGARSTVKNLKLNNVDINVDSSNGGALIGGVAGATSRNPGEEYKGAVIDGCEVKGKINGSSTNRNLFEGALVGYFNNGAIINCVSDAEIDGTNNSAWNEVGGIAGMNNGGMIANSYSKSNIKMTTGDNNEGYSAGGQIAGFQGGVIVNCYSSGNINVKHDSDYVGMLAGWARGYCKSYNCKYSKNAIIKMADKNMNPIKEIGTQSPLFADEQGLYYIGGLADKLGAFSENTTLVKELNSEFEAFPIEITKYGISEKSLCKWEYENTGAKHVTLSSEKVEAKYKRPDCENIPQVTQTMRDGVWYGRDGEKKSIVKITVEKGKIHKIDIKQGEPYGSAFEEAVKKAEEKAVYGDSSSYEPADGQKFAGGSGTEKNPYKIANEKQLRYLAESINEDVNWEGKYFVQTSDIKLSGKDWLPIGWGIIAKIKGKVKEYCAYPFKGNYDGKNFRITGLKMGKKSKPLDSPQNTYTAGLFGYVEGDENTNNTPQSSETRYVNLKNIHVVDADINIASTYDGYVGGIAGMAEKGIKAENCTVTGNINVKGDKEDIYVGGLFGESLRGVIKNSWTNVNIKARGGESDVTVGGLNGMDNRVTTVNCCAVGNVEAESDKGRPFAGGLSGNFAGIRYNCYAAGTVIAPKDDKYVGAVNGNLSGIGGESFVYYNKDLGLKANGNSAGAQNQCGEIGKTAKELKSKAFADLLNQNRKNAKTELEKIHEIVKDINHHGHGLYYSGNGSDLEPWEVIKGVVILKNAALWGDIIVAGSSPVDIKKCKIQGVKNKIYTGKNITQKIRVKYGSENATFKLTYGDRKNIGKRYVKIQGTGKYKGSVKKYYKILPQKVKIKKLVPGKRKAKIRWKPAGGGVSYQIAYKRKNGTFRYIAVDKKFVSKTIKRLKSKRIYIFKMRAFKKVSGKVYRGSWSKSMKAKIK